MMHALNKWVCPIHCNICDCAMMRRQWDCESHRYVEISYCVLRETAWQSSFFIEAFFYILMCGPLFQNMQDQIIHAILCEWLLMGLLCARILRRIVNGHYNIANLLVTVLKNRGAMKQLGALVLTF